MNAQRFVAPNSREAMALARAAFGEQAVILSSRSTEQGFEVVATSEDQLARIAAQAASPAALQSHAQLPETPAARGGRALNLQQRAAAQLPPLSPDSTVAQDTETLAMSTLSFQEYVRERMLRKRREAMQGKLAADTAATTPVPAARAVPPARPQPPAADGMILPFGHGASAGGTVPAARAKGAAAPRPATPAPAPAAAALTAQLDALKAMMEERFQTLAWLGQTKLNPIQSQLMHKFIRAGYSPTVARAVLERLPAHLDASGAWRWTLEVLARNLRVAREPGQLCDEGGVFALIGSTGVGKTTTAAKLAAQCVKAYGANSVGLITLDTYRVAGYEQLRTYGRMLGVVAHLAHDRAALQDLLELLANKRMVIIDTAGLGQRDPRIREMMSLLAAPSIKKLLVVNAGSHGDTLDDVFGAYRETSLHGVILSKVDEAAKLGPAVDALIRHQTVLRGLTTGQRVPEDWQRPDATALVRLSMGSQGKSAYDPTSAELPFFFTDPTSSSWKPQGVAHA
ncbi:flagellar biosynthesis protein FlhF [Tepidimonas taiwanensis]|uniref:Flagellar biosynthesis protein FlhF n=1 Tax=Tepidimonas taiwanensis TaxID=307486 RepID=A0A554XCK5_9BURK|nr:flagellar biosynthesis protein FlhF [Tepidimonas taiwanensis]MCX7691792.1 flagellar biosynthesis protein FlhF [Tepidimonas taiwanensis]MDM7464227.1 flagellar biosynthesis protein FlhF [Tepidimonas taiwanensis]TSE33529.1 Flagellar biosynthesis protein FlhF [Tepidimonas taiwanensis]UBQ05770.1 flagellar biosynthesis protein FlhF [Tepidimonas taiwanensis]